MKTSQQKLFPIKLARRRVSDGHVWHWLQRFSEFGIGVKKPTCGSATSGMIEGGLDEIGIEDEHSIIIRSQSTLEEIIRGGENHEIHNSRVCMKCRHILKGALELHKATSSIAKVDPEYPFIVTHDGEILQPSIKTLTATKELAQKTIAENPLTPLTVVLPHITYKQTEPVIKEIRSSYTPH